LINKRKTTTQRITFF